MPGSPQAPPGLTSFQVQLAQLFFSLPDSVDTGFDPAIFAEMLRTLTRFSDDELPIDSTEKKKLRNFFTDWAAELRP